jgi:hypothetical protein
MTFTGTDSCGNSPKNVFVATFEENLFNGDKEALAEVVADDCVLQIVHPSDVETHTGRDAVVEALLNLSGSFARGRPPRSGDHPRQGRSRMGILASRGGRRRPAALLAHDVVHHAQSSRLRADPDLSSLSQNRVRWT